MITTKFRNIFERIKNGFKQKMFLNCHEWKHDPKEESSKSHVTDGDYNGSHESHTNNMDNSNSIDEDLWKEYSDADTIILTDDDRSFDDISIEEEECMQKKRKRSSSDADDDDRSYKLQKFEAYYDLSLCPVFIDDHIKNCIEQSLSIVVPEDIECSNHEERKDHCTNNSVTAIR